LTHTEMERELGELISNTTSSTVTLRDVTSKEERKLLTLEHQLKEILGLLLMRNTVLLMMTSILFTRKMLVQRIIPNNQELLKESKYAKTDKPMWLMDLTCYTDGILLGLDLHRD
jgi:hypothetical protein